jgi:hypothetical protein
MLKQAIIAEVTSPHVPDFDGNGLAYLQAVYRGEVKPDPIRMQAAMAAARFGVPSLSASMTANVGPATPPMIVVHTGVPRSLDSDDGAATWRDTSGDLAGDSDATATARQITRLLRDLPEVAELVLAQLVDPDRTP